MSLTRNRLRASRHWLAFTSDESGATEVYLLPCPSGPKRLVSESDGESPVRRRDGKELFYVSADGRLNAVAIAPRGSDLQIGLPLGRRLSER